MTPRRTKPKPTTGSPKPPKAGLGVFPHQLRAGDVVVDEHGDEWELMGRPAKSVETQDHVTTIRRVDRPADGATMALNKGFSAPIVMALGGWKTEGMMRRYAAVTDQTLRAEAEAVAGHEPVPLATRMATLTEVRATIR